MLGGFHVVRYPDNRPREDRGYVLETRKVGRHHRRRHHTLNKTNFAHARWSADLLLPTVARALI